MLNSAIAAPRALATKVRDGAERFLTVDQPLLALLANPGLRDRHWSAMEAAVGFDLPHDDTSTTLNDMLELKLETHVSEIEEFCTSAAKEYSLERALDRMASEWATVQLDLKPYKASGTYILGGGSVDELQSLLDDHIVKTR
jgi:dynein heavy chain